jgi:hypothetical protein
VTIISNRAALSIALAVYSFFLIADFIIDVANPIVKSLARIASPG